VCVAKEAMSLVVSGERGREWRVEVLFVDVLFISVSIFWVIAGCGCLGRDCGLEATYWNKVLFVCGIIGQVVSEWIRTVMQRW
jgi:hypothetical protein